MVAVRRLRRWNVLARLATGKGWRIGAELGVFRGETFFHLLATCPDLAMVGVDCWEPKPEKDGIEGGRSYARHDLDSHYAAVREKTAPYGSRAVLLRMNTVDAAAHFPDGHFDFVFIDADHTYEGVRSDIAAWLPKIRPGGTMLGHDWNRKDFPGVIRAVEEWFGGPDLLHPDHVWAVQC